MTAKTTQTQALAEGLVTGCAVQAHDRTLTQCQLKGSRPYTAVWFVGGRLRSMELEVSERGSELSAANKALVDLVAQDIASTKADECSTNGALSSFRFCFSDGSVTWEDATSTAFGTTMRAVEVKFEVSPAIVASYAAKPAIGPIEREIASATIAENIQTNPESRRRNGDDSYFQLDGLGRENWYWELKVTNRSCAALGQGKYSCSYDWEATSFPYGTNLNSFSAALLGPPKGQTQSGRRTDQIFEKVNGEWRSPTTRARFVAARAAALAARPSAATSEIDAMDKRRAYFEEEYRKSEMERKERETSTCLNNALMAGQMAFC